MTTSPRPQADPLVVDSVRKSYRNLVVLDGVSFVLQPGTATIIGGINGTGKSTLLRCLAGLARFEGQVHFGDTRIQRNADPELRRRISYLPQAPGLPETGTVREVIDLFSTMRGAAPDPATLPRDFLPPLDARLRTLSGGQQQRVALTIAMLGSPQLLLLDEPTANLDAAGRDAVWTALRSLTERGHIVVIASPAPSELDGTADRIIELELGRVATDCTPISNQGRGADVRALSFAVEAAS